MSCVEPTYRFCSRRSMRCVATSGISHKLTLPGRRNVARVQILTAHNHPRYGDAAVATTDTDTPCRIAPAPIVAAAECLPAIPPQPRIPPGVHADRPALRQRNETLHHRSLLLAHGRGLAGP